MSQQVVQEILAGLESLRLIDPHTHINPHSAASATLADILGYHYYTELAHSAGLAREQIEEPGISPKEKVGRLVPWLATIENTAQYSWLLEMCRVFFGFDGERIDESSCETYPRADKGNGKPYDRVVTQRQAQRNGDQHKDQHLFTHAESGPRQREQGDDQRDDPLFVTRLAFAQLDDVAQACVHRAGTGEDVECPADQEDKADDLRGRDEPPDGPHEEVADTLGRRLYLMIGTGNDNLPPGYLRPVEFTGGHDPGEEDKAQHNGHDDDNAIREFLEELHRRRCLSVVFSNIGSFGENLGKVHGKVA